MKKWLLFLLLLPAVQITAQSDTLKVLVASPAVGPVIDSAEKVKYGAFPFWKKEEFVSAYFVLQPDSSVLLSGTMKDGSVRTMPLSRRQYQEMVYVISYRAGLVPVEKTDWVYIVLRIAAAGAEVISDY